MPGIPPKSALLITQYYWPELIGSAPYCTDLAESLAEQGTTVRVLTCRPHYPEGRIPRAYHRGRRDREEHGGALVHRIPPWRPHRHGTIDRMIREGMFLLRGLAALASRGIRRDDLVVSLCPSILSVLLAVFATRSGGRHVALVHDIPSGLATGLGMIGGSLLERAMKWVEAAVLNRTSVILVLSPNMRTRLRSQGVRTPIEVLPIWVDTERIRPIQRHSAEAPTVLYSGNLGRKQALRQVIGMVEELEGRKIDVRVVLRGEGSQADDLAAEVVARGLRSVHFMPLVPAERLSEGLAEGDIHLVPQDGNTADFAVPSKIFSIMASGRPFVATARPGSLLWEVKDRSRAFLCVPSGNAAALAGAVERLVRSPRLRRELGRNGRSYVLTHHERAAVLERFHAVLGHGWTYPHDLNARPASPDPGT